jgi:amino acid transporter
MVDEGFEKEPELPILIGKGKYRKELGFWTVVMLTVGAIFGSAVAFVPIYVLAYGGPAGVLAWPIALLMILPIAFVYVELGSMWPRAGGVAYYPARSHGTLVGLINGWSTFLGYTLALPTQVAVVIEYIGFYYPSLYQNGTITPLGIGLGILVLFLIFIVEVRHVKIIGNVNNGFTLAKASLMVLIALVLITFFHVGNFTANGGFTPLGVSGIFLAISATIFAYAGFRQPIDYAEEVKDPGRFLPRAISISLVIVMILYVLESLAFLGTINWSKLNLSPGSWGSLFSLGSPFTSASVNVGLVAFGVLAVIVIIIASFSDGLVYWGGAARIGNTMSRYNKYFPNFFSDLSGRGIPFNSVVVVFAIAIFYLILLPSFASLIGVFVDAVVISYAQSAISLAVFREKNPNEKRPYKLPAYKIMAPLAYVLAGLMVYWSGFTAVSISIASVYAGLLFLILAKRKNNFSVEDLYAGLWLPFYLITVVVISYFGSSFFGGTNFIRFPYDNIVFILDTLLFYFIGFHYGLRYHGKGVADAPA